MNIKHTIIVLTYNQERYIDDALSCLFRHQTVPHEVIVSDDCSSDKTQEIILKYHKLYPNIIRPYFNKKNLGIYNHLNNIKSSIEINGDVISFLAGDDYFKDGMLSEFDSFIASNKLLPRNEMFLLLTNVVNLLPTGQEIFFNNYHKRDANLFKLRLRGEVGSRLTGISRKLYDAMPAWDLDIGIWADYVHACDLFYLTEKFYFINKTFPVYREGVGVSSKASPELTISYIKALNVVKEKYESIIDEQDLFFIDRELVKHKLMIAYKLKLVFIFIFYSFVCLPKQRGIKVWLRDFTVLLPVSFKLFIKKILK